MSILKFLLVSVSIMVFLSGCYAEPDRKTAEEGPDVNSPAFKAFVIYFLKTRAGEPQGINELRAEIALQKYLKGEDNGKNK